MSQGVLIFAFNNETVDYLKMAEWSAHNIHRLLDLPVAVVTNSDVNSTVFDHVISSEPFETLKRKFGDFERVTTSYWYNGNRVDAYRITPFEQTLVLDADYIVASTQLKELFAIDQNFLSHRWAYDITNCNPFQEHNYFGAHAMPMWWATVMMFKKSEQAEHIFDCMNMIRENWEHYRQLYGINKKTYRNDFALTIAQSIVNGHVLNHADIPWKLATLLPGAQLSRLDEDVYRIEYINAEQQKKYITLANQDLHVMGKFQLGDMIANTL